MNFKRAVILGISIFLFTQAREPKCALITGVSRGIGHALAENLLRRGLFVVGVARQSPETCMKGLLAHPQFRYLSADLSSSAGLSALDHFIRENQYSFDIIIHNAATIEPAYLQEAQAEAVESLIGINLLAPIKLTHILAHSYRPYARIACISSGAATHPIVQLGAYCISKAGLLMFVRILREEFIDRDIGIVSIIPGVVDTHMQQVLREDLRGDIQAEFQALHDEKELISPSTCADYIAWLVCDVPFKSFKQKALWDIGEKSGINRSILF